MKYTTLAGISLLAASTLTSYAAGAAESYPSKTVTIVMPYSAGGASDLLARSVAKAWETCGAATSSSKTVPAPAA